MLKPSDFNNAVPQFSNGNYASNPINPQYVEEPSSTDYNHGTEPLQTLPAQWWNWFINKFTSRFNKVNIYVKNLFNELAQLLSLVNVTPDGTEGAVTDGQLKNAFKELYPDYINTKLALESTYVKKTQKVNGHALSGDVTVTKSDVGLGNVPNVSTNDQTPSYTEASTLTTLSSGEKLSIAFGKLAKAVSSLISHINNTSNPHSVTKAQVQLGNVENTGDSATPVENGTTKFTTGGAFTELGKKLNGISARYTVNQGSVPTNKYILIFERTAPVSYFGLAFHIFGQFGQISSLKKQTFEILIDFRNASSSVDFHAITDRAYNNFDVIATWDNNTNTARVYLEIKQGYASANINAIEGGLKLPFTAYSSMLGTPSGYTFLSQATIVQTNVKNSLASNFTSTRAYAVGDCVLYNSLLYKCTTAHSAGPWDPSHFTAVNLSSLYNELYNDINKPSVYYFSNPVATNKTIHLGSFSASTFEQYGINITIEGTRADGSSKLDASVTNGKLHIGMTSGNISNISLRMFKTDSTHADLYLDISSYMNSIYVKYTNMNRYTHDGSAVNSYTGTEVFPTYTLSSVAPTFNTATSYTVGDMATHDGILYTCTTAHSAGAWNASHFTVNDFNSFYNFTGGAKEYNKWLQTVFGWSMGVNWVDSNIQKDGPHSLIEYGNGLWLTIVNQKYLYKSTDGKIWTDTGYVFINGVDDLIYSNNMWMATCNAAVGQGVWWSTDGETWARGTGNYGNSLVRHPYYGNGMWLISVYGTGSSDAKGIWWSTNGKAWSQGTGANQTYSTNTFVYGNGIWVAGMASHGFWWSTDGKSWTQNTGSSTSTSVLCLYYHDGLFIGGTNANGIWYSVDGKNWTQCTGIGSSYRITCLLYSNGLWIAGTYEHGLWWSNDGIRWNQSAGNSTSYTIMGISYSNGIWIAGTSQHGVYRSTNGKSWVQVNEYMSSYEISVNMKCDGYTWVIGSYNNGILWSSCKELLNSLDN